VDKTDKAAGFSNMIMQKLEKCLQLANWISGKKCPTQRQKKKKKNAVRRQVRLGQSEQDKQPEETYQRGRKVRRCQRRMSRWQKIM